MALKATAGAAPERIRFDEGDAAWFLRERSLLESALFTALLMYRVVTAKLSAAVE